VATAQKVIGEQIVLQLDIPTVPSTLIGVPSAITRVVSIAPSTGVMPNSRATITA
jgi:hypothetical protein